MIKFFFNYTTKIKLLMLRKIRGFFYKLFIIKKSGKNLSIGKNVTIINGQFLKIGSNCFIDDNCYINAKSKKGIRIGNNVTLNRNCYLHCFGNRKGQGIIIKNNVTIGNNTIIYGHSLVTIGCWVALGPNVVIVPVNHRFDNLKQPIRKQGLIKKPIIIENNCWIGSNAKILAGSIIKTGSIIGSGAVVNKKIKKESIAVGVPAKIIKTR